MPLIGRPDKDGVAVRRGVLVFFGSGMPLDAAGRPSLLGVASGGPGCWWTPGRRRALPPPRRFGRGLLADSGPPPAAALAAETFTTWPSVALACGQCSPTGPGESERCAACSPAEASLP